MKKLITLAFN